MDLVLWRHADAEEGGNDAARRLTPKGLKQAARMAAWLQAHLPKSVRVIASPAERAQQTAQALSTPFETSDLIGTGARPADVLKAAGWPAGIETVIVVGHQPTLGATAALAITGKVAPWHMKKGAVWWLRADEGAASAVVVAVVPPNLL